MYLRRNYSKETGRTHLAIVQGYRDAAGKSKQRTVEKIGYLDELEKEYDDPIAHFEAVAAEMDKARLSAKSVAVTIDMDSQLERNCANRKNYGHIVFSKIYHELGVDKFLKNARRHEAFRFNTDAIMRLMVFSRLLYPGSKRAAVLNKGLFFDKFDFTLDDAYDALTHFDKVSDALQERLHKEVAERYGRETDIVYYDVTNYYFEIDLQDDFRKKGAEKNHRKDPIVQMGLLLDRAGLPISYKLFPGNTHDSKTLVPVLKGVKKDFGIERVVIVADKGLNCGDNISYNSDLGDGYIYSKSVRGASAGFKEWALDGAGYGDFGGKYRYKSKIVPEATIFVTSGQDGKKKKKAVTQKWVVYYSEKYAARARHKRGEAIEKALKIIGDPAKYRCNYNRGAADYIENLAVDKNTGEILNVGEVLVLNTQKIEEEKKYDGYNSIVTSELDDTDEHIIELYGELWRIEESFKVTKCVFEARPIYLRTKAHINAHFLICFISLLIARIAEMRLERKYTIAKITETLRNVACSHLDRNVWLFDFANDATDDINAVFGTDFGKKAMTLNEIRKNLGEAKKR